MGATALAKKVLRAGYLYPTMVQDAQDYVKKYNQCPKHEDVFNAPSTELHVLTLPWSFMQWRMDLLCPFALAPNQLSYLIVVVDYFTKWIEVEALVKITM